MGLDLEALKKSLLERGVTSQNAYNPSQAAEVLALIEELAEARAQLPEGMKRCTILFKECEKGHGWLTATNWVQHGCPHCDLANARAAAMEEAAPPGFRVVEEEVIQKVEAEAKAFVAEWGCTNNCPPEDMTCDTQRLLAALAALEDGRGKHGT